MRTSKATLKKETNRPLNKKTRRTQRVNTLWTFQDDIGREKLEKINEVIRASKERSFSGSWQLVPKDSRLVYRERRRRGRYQVKRQCSRKNKDRQRCYRRHSRDTTTTMMSVCSSCRDLSTEATCSDMECESNKTF